MSRGLVEREHRNALLVTVGDELVASGGVDHWLSSADPKADLAARVREILATRRAVAYEGVRQ